MRNTKQAYSEQKSKAAERGIKFLLTFKEWMKIWNDSGKLSLRGRRKNEYHMARNGDIGPYSINNVKIIPGRENRSKAAKGKKRPPRSKEHCRKISEALRGIKRGKRPPEFGRKISAALQGIKRSVETRRRISEAKLGTKLRRLSRT